MKADDAISILGNYALTGATTTSEHLAVYDSIAEVAWHVRFFAPHTNLPLETRDSVEAIWKKAKEAAAAIRAADQQQMEFREMLAGRKSE